MTMESGKRNHRENKSILAGDQKEEQKAKETPRDEVCKNVLNRSNRSFPPPSISDRIKHMYFVLFSSLTIFRVLFFGATLPPTPPPLDRMGFRSFAFFQSKFSSIFIFVGFKWMEARKTFAFFFEFLKISFQEVDCGFFFLDMIGSWPFEWFAPPTTVFSFRRFYARKLWLNDFEPGYRLWPI